MIILIIMIIIINTLFIRQKNRPAEYKKKTDGINLSGIIKYFKIKKNDST